MRVDVIESAEGLEALEPAWRELLMRVPDRNIFLTFEWISTLWRHFDKTGRLTLAVAREGGDVLAIAPLAVTRVEGFRKLGFIGPNLSDYEGLILSPGREDEAVAAIFGTLRRRFDWDYFQFTRTPVDSPTYGALSGQEDDWPGGHRRCRFSVAPYATLSGGWESLWESYDKKFRGDSARRKRKLAQEVGAIDFVHARDESDVRLLMDETINNHRLRRNARDYSQFEDASIRGFYHDVALVMFRAGRLNLMAMKAGGRIVATRFGFRYAGKCFELVPAFDERLKRYAPGRLLLLYWLERCCRDGAVEFDMCLGDEPYKLDLMPGRRELASFTWSRPELRGRACEVWVNRVRPRLRQVDGLRKLKPILQRLSHRS